MAIHLYHVRRTITMDFTKTTMTFKEAKELIAKKYSRSFSLSDEMLEEAVELYAKTKVTESSVDLRNINIQLREQRNQYTIEQIKKHLEIAANEADVIYRGHSFGDYIVDKESITGIKIELT